MVHLVRVSVALLIVMNSAAAAFADPITVDYLSANAYPLAPPTGGRGRVVDGSTTNDPDPDGKLDGHASITLDYTSRDADYFVSSTVSAQALSEGSFAFTLSGVMDRDGDGQGMSAGLFAQFTTGDSPLAWSVTGLLDVTDYGSNRSALHFSLRQANTHLARHGYYSEDQPYGASDLELGSGVNAWATEPHDFPDALSGVLAPNTLYTLDILGEIRTLNVSYGSVEGSISGRFLLGPAGSPRPTPEPGSLLLLATGIGGLWIRRRHGSKASGES